MTTATFQQRYGTAICGVIMLAMALYVLFLGVTSIAVVLIGGFIGGYEAGILGAVIGGAIGLVVAFVWWMLNDLALRLLVGVITFLIAIVKAV